MPMMTMATMTVDDAEDEEGVVKAWEGQQHPHASRPSAHPITHTEEKCERFSAILYVPHMYTTSSN